MSNLTSSLTVTLKDDVTRPARSAAKAMEDVRNKAKQIAQQMGSVQGPEKLVRSLQKLGLEKKDIEAVANAWKKYSQDMKLAGNAGNWTKTQAAAVREWESQTIRALREVKRERAAFDRVMRKPAPVPGGGAHGGHNKWTGGHASLAATIGAGAIGHGMLHLTRESLVNAAERQHEVVQMMQAGMKADEIERVKAEALRLAKTTPNLDPATLMELHKEARSALQHPEEAFEMMPELAKATSRLKAMGSENVNVADLVKAAESMGMMGSPERFHKFLEGQVKAMSVMGKTIDTAQIYEAAKYSKSAGATLSDEFINLVLPSLIQEMHGSSAGNALSMMTKTLRGGLQNKMTAVKVMDKLGLLPEQDKFVKTKTGAIHGYMGKVKGDDLLAADPGKWMTEVFKPAAVKAGYTTLSDQIRLLNQILPSTAANLGRILLQQEDTLKAHREYYTGAAGLDQGMENQAEDPKVAMEGLNTSFQALLGTLSSPMMKTAATNMTSFSKTMSGWSESFAEWQKANPELGKLVGGGAVAAGTVGGGALMYGALGGLMNGFGLKGSALALDGSATALTRAAVALGAGGKLGAFQGGELPGGKPSGKPGGGKLSFGWKLLTGLNYLGFGLEAIDDVANGTPEKRMEELRKNWEASDKLNKNMGNWANQYLPSWLQFDENGNRQGLLDKWIHGSNDPKAVAERAAAEAEELTAMAKIRGRNGLSAAQMARIREQAEQRFIGWNGSAGIPTTGWMPGGNGAGAGNSSGVDAVSAKAQQAGQDINALNVTASPKVDTAGIDAGIEKARELLMLLSSIGGQMSGLAAGIRLPSVGKAMRGNFSTGDVHGAG